MTDIKSMKLYTHVERVHHELAELGISEQQALNVEQLSRFDQLHYHGSDALDLALDRLDPAADQRWLEIGSGIGGPARYLAYRADIDITALELQPDQNRLAEQLTARCGLVSRVEHVCGDFLEYDFGQRHFDAVVSWLALYHIPERIRLLEKCRHLLLPGGRFYTEDLCRLGPIGTAQMAQLERDLYAITLPTIDEYRRDLEQQGFVIENCTDMSADWAEFTRQRLAAYRTERDRHVSVQGEATVVALDEFYSAVDRQFQSGKLGGVRICARTGE